MEKENQFKPSSQKPMNLQEMIVESCKLEEQFEAFVETLDSVARADARGAIEGARIRFSDLRMAFRAVDRETPPWEG